MRFAFMAATIATGLAAGGAQAQVPTNPYAYTCGNYLAAQEGERGQANAMLFWATGYLQGRLVALPNLNFSADNFQSGLQDVHAALLQICPNIPNMPIAEFMANFATDFEKSATPLE